MKEKINQIMESYGYPTMFVLSLIMFFRTCSTSTSVTRIEKRLESIDSSASTVTKREVDSIVKSRLYDFLIFEEDLDKGKTSLSDIRIKISSDEK
jgi:2-oxo-4-hydroxy-4-carboxy--5-ureidoimidazoline (OHCU) decarboxylase